MNYKYMTDSDFLREIDELPVKEQWVKITLLEFTTEKTIGEIQGKVKNGSFNFNGKSSMRRTAQFSMVAEDNGDITNANNLISINKKCKIEVGLTNTTFKYPEFPIIWYPIGTYVVTEAQVNRGKENVTISVNLKDKMCLLNGECGGTIPAAATLSEYDTIDGSGKEIVKKITLVQLIREIVNHYGDEQLGKIIISDLDTRVKQVMMWNLDQPLYFYDDGSYRYSLTPLEGLEPTKIFEKGDDVGFIFTDFTYPGQLTSVAGDTVCTVLDKIVSVLGNFEYFYDLDGNFIFQEIKNNLNTAKSSEVLKPIEDYGKITTKENKDYLIDLTRGVSEYDFSDSKLIKTFSNNPHYNNIKNDYMVWGMRKTATGQNFPIRFHLAVDKKPSVEDVSYDVYVYIDENGIKRARVPLDCTAVNGVVQEPAQGVEGYFYRNINPPHEIYIWTLDKRTIGESDLSGHMAYIQYPLPMVGFQDNGVVGWYYLYNGNTYLCAREKTGKMTAKDCYDLQEEPLYREVTIEPTDWRTVLYLQGIVAEPTGTASNFYYSELYNEWPKCYDIELGEWITDKKNLDFYLDFIDTDSNLGQLSVNNIGRRSMVIDDKNINCIFENDIIDCILIEAGQVTTEELEQECDNRGQRWCQVDTAIFDNLVTGGSANSAYEMVKDLLYQYTSYNETVAISTVPMYHLQPGIRVTIQDTKTGIYGDYMLNSISCSLEVSGTMNLSCTRCLEKI